MKEMLAKGTEVFVITTKQRRFATQLLNGYGVGLPSEQLYALEDGPKTQVLKALLKRRLEL